MAIATLSPEGRMIERLRNLNCAEYNFAQIATGIVGKTRLAQAFKDSTKCFDRTTAAALTEKLTQMEELQASVSPCPVDWSRCEEVRMALSVRLANAVELEAGNTELQDAAKRVSQSVSIKS